MVEFSSQLCLKRFFILRTILRDTTENVQTSLCKVYQLFLSDSNETWIFSIGFQKMLPYQNSWKSITNLRIATKKNYTVIEHGRAISDSYSVTMNTALWFVKSYPLIHRYKRFKRNCNFHFHGRRGTNTMNKQRQQLAPNPLFLSPKTLCFNPANKIVHLCTGTEDLYKPYGP